VLQAVRELGLRYVVITSVTRDDLSDGGASHFARTVRLIKNQLPGTRVEVLIPDFQGNPEALRVVLDAGPDVLNHNVETVPRFYPEVRPQADYTRSLELLRRAKEYAVQLARAEQNPAHQTTHNLSSIVAEGQTSGDLSQPHSTFQSASGPSHDHPLIYPSTPRGPLREGTLRTKSGIMVGLGETESEVVAVLRDLSAVGCDYLTIGQYLAPSRNHHPVVEYVTPQQFSRYRDIALELGFLGVASGPFVRSSYHAAEMAGERAH